MEEIWKPVIGYEGYYDVSNLGRVKSLPRKGSPKEKIIKGGKARGYRIMLFSVGMTRTYLYLHKLVANTFIPNPYSKKEVNHIDANKDNNVVSNLEWATRQENMNHAESNNLVPRMAGEKNGSSKLKICDVEYIRQSKLSTKELSKKYKVCRNSILNIKNYKTWK